MKQWIETIATIISFVSWCERSDNIPACNHEQILGMHSLATATWKNCKIPTRSTLSRTHTHTEKKKKLMRTMCSCATTHSFPTVIRVPVVRPSHLCSAFLPSSRSTRGIEQRNWTNFEPKCKWLLVTISPPWWLAPECGMENGKTNIFINFSSLFSVRARALSVNFKWDLVIEVTHTDTDRSQKLPRPRWLGLAVVRFFFAFISFFLDSG